jgi:hypothetical protein
LKRIEDLAPDVRYDNWNKKSQFDRQIITSSRATSSASIEPQLPQVKNNLLESLDKHDYYSDNLLQAQANATANQNKALEFSRELQKTRQALEKEIQKQLIEQLLIREQKKSVTPEQQTLIEKLYLDLRLINPELALATLKASADLANNPQTTLISTKLHHKKKTDKKNRSKSVSTKKN